MPRIAVALGVATTIAVCIAINTYRYPMVREMVATAPQLQLPSGQTETEPKTPEPLAAAAPSRSAPAVEMASTGRASSDPKPSWRSDETEPATSHATPKEKAVAKSKPPKAPAAKGERAGGKNKASGKSSNGMEDDLPGAVPAGPTEEEPPVVAQTEPDRQPAGAEAEVAANERPCPDPVEDAARDGATSEIQQLPTSLGDDWTAESPAAVEPESRVVEPESKYAALAEQQGTDDSPATQNRPLAPLAPLAAAEAPPEVQLPGGSLPDWNTPDAAKDRVERLPPTDQVWGAAATIAPAAGDRIAIYPETGS